MVEQPVSRPDLPKHVAGITLLPSSLTMAGGHLALHFGIEAADLRYKRFRRPSTPEAARDALHPLIQE